MSQFTKDKIQMWEQEVLIPILNGGEPPEEQTKQLGGLALLSADTDKIKEYVFESAKLPEIRGGSMILDELNQGYPDDDDENLRKLFEAKGFDIKKGNKDSCIIYAGGGSLLALVPLDAAQELQPEIEALYPRETDTATITCIIRPITLTDLQPDGTLLTRLKELKGNLPEPYQKRVARYEEKLERAPSPFSRLMQIQATDLRRKKEEKMAAPLFESIPYARQCDSCGRRPSSDFEKSPPPGRYLCQVCYRKAGQATELAEGKPTERRARKTKWHQEFNIRFPIRFPDIHSEAPKDLEAIGKDSTKEGYIGFIYTDGDEVGAKLEETGSLLEYRSRSSALAAATQNAVYTALREHLLRADGKNVRSFEIITIGGDDTLLIVPADAALAIARDICLQFEKTLKPEEWSGKPPTMSAGVVIAHQDNPVNFLFKTAMDLLKSAKQKSHKIKQGAVDFLIFKSQSMLSTNLKHLRASPPLYFSPNGGKERLFLTARPFTLDELDKLLATAHKLREAGFGQSWLKNLSFNLSRGRLATSIYYLYQYARLPDSRRKVLSDLQHDWEMGQNNGWLHAAPPWRYRGVHNKHREFETPWPDFIEVMEFLPGKKGE